VAERNAEAFRALGFVFVFVLLLGGLALLFPGLMDVAGGPDVQVLAALKETEPEGLRVPVAGYSEPLLSTRHGYTRIAIVGAAPGGDSELTATLDLTGNLGPIEVSSLGVEKLRFRREGSAWKPVEGWAPALAEALALLEKRRKALEDGKISAIESLVRPQDRALAMADPALKTLLALKGRKLVLHRLFLRSEREEMLVTEEDRLTGDLPDRPVDEKRSHRLRLVRDGREFFFTPTVM
jgi:hypothetical protein